MQILKNINTSCERGLALESATLSVLVSMSYFRPFLVVAGRIHPLRGTCVIGRWHKDCPSHECMRKGFWTAPQVSVSDSYGYVSRHHVRVQLASNRECWIQDLHSLNGTVIFHTGQSARAQPYLERLVPGAWHFLSDGDLIALGYHQYRGPYFVISYHENGRW
jgi:hypothetical protein